MPRGQRCGELGVGDATLCGRNGAVEFAEKSLGERFLERLIVFRTLFPDRPGPPLIVPVGNRDDDLDCGFSRVALVKGRVLGRGK